MDEIAQKYPRAKPAHRVEDLFADDAVAGILIATPAETHAGLVRRALEAGKDVLVVVSLGGTMLRNGGVVLSSDERLNERLGWRR